jgi:nitroreductase
VTVRQFVRAGQQAATDATGQLYSVYWARSSEQRAAIAALIGDQAHVARSPVLLLILYDTRRLRLLLEHRGERFGMGSGVGLLFGLTDAALFAQTLVLAAESEGLGTCYLGSVQNAGQDIARLLRLPKGVVPLYGLTLGRPARTSPPKPRIPTDHVLHVDGYQDPSPAVLDRIYAEMSKATRSGDWLNPIRKYFGVDGIMARREQDWRDLLREQGLGLDS